MKPYETRLKALGSIFALACTLALVGSGCATSGGSGGYYNPYRNPATGVDSRVEAMQFLNNQWNGPNKYQPVVPTQQQPMCLNAWGMYSPCGR